jgi:hypothetical protein
MLDAVTTALILLAAPEGTPGFWPEGWAVVTLVCDAEDTRCGSAAPDAEHWAETIGELRADLRVARALPPLWVACRFPPREDCLVRLTAAGELPKHCRRMACHQPWQAATWFWLAEYYERSEGVYRNMRSAQGDFSRRSRRESIDAVVRAIGWDDTIHQNWPEFAACWPGDG